MVQQRVTPEHTATLPFTRMLAGPMDFTPGGFLNRQPRKFRQGVPANVMGTRAMNWPSSSSSKVR